MMPQKNKLKKYILWLVILSAIAYVVVFQYPKLNLIAGYTAKDMVSQVFLAHRSPNDVRKIDHNLPLLKLATTKIDTVAKTATASVLGLCERKAVFVEGVGSVLLPPDVDKTALKSIKRLQPPLKKSYPYGNAPAKDTLFPQWNDEKIKAVLEKAFTEENPYQPKNTRAILVLYKDCLIAERYADGFDKDTKLVGWSMTKSITATLFGVLAYQKGFDIHRPLANYLHNFVAWQKDNRAKITTANLLQMDSGLAFNEDYSTISDVTNMLYLDADMTERPFGKKLAHPIGKRFYYSTGTSHVLSKVLRGYIKDFERYRQFPYGTLFDKIGMYSALIESDVKGNFVTGAYGWATPRDWAKLGLLYLHNGMWNGTKIFDADWVRYVTAPKTKSTYGGHFWTNVNGDLYPDLPKDTYSMNGHYGQRVIIIPSMDLVFVRMGLTPDRENDPSLDKMSNDLVRDFCEAYRF